MIPTRYEVKSWNEWDGVSLKSTEDGDLLLYTDAEKWVKEEVATLTDKLQEAQQNYDTAFGEWHRCIEQIAALEEKAKEDEKEIKRLKMSLLLQ